MNLHLSLKWMNWLSMDWYVSTELRLLLYNEHVIFNLINLIHSLFIRLWFLFDCNSYKIGFSLVRRMLLELVIGKAWNGWEAGTVRSNPLLPKIRNNLLIGKKTIFRNFGCFFFVEIQTDFLQMNIRKMRKPRIMLEPPITRRPTW